MAKMTRAKARKRLLEAEAKFKKVYMSSYGIRGGAYQESGMIVKTADMEAVSKIVARCIKRAR